MKNKLLGDCWYLLALMILSFYHFLFSVAYLLHISSWAYSSKWLRFSCVLCLPTQFHSHCVFAMWCSVYHEQKFLKFSSPITNLWLAKVTVPYSLMQCPMKIFLINFLGGRSIQARFKHVIKIFLFLFSLV